MFKKSLCLILSVVMIFSAFPATILAEIVPDNNTDEETLQEEGIDENIISSKKTTYGPYNETNKEQKHAYEPFNDTNNDKSSIIQGTNYSKDKVLIKLDNTSSYSSMSLNTGLDIEEIVNIEPIIKSSKKFSAQSNDKDNELKKWYIADLAEGTDVVEVIDKLLENPKVIAAEPDYIRTIDNTTPTAITDPKIIEQWHLDSTNTKEAWDYLDSEGINPGGSRDVVVAVIDTGVDSSHPDLKGNMWVNTGEIPGNGIDDDNNGYKDDINGASTVGNKWAGESGNSLDDHGHGTHVAGIIAASANDGGITGIAYNTQIMSIKAAQSGGVLTSSDIVEAIYYAVEKGADVINMSFGGYGRNQLEEDALQVAYGQAVLVAAAGNSGIPNRPHPAGKDFYPAAYPWILGVMAESRNKFNLANFSNWDFIEHDIHEYELMAPGVDVLSTLPNGKYAKWDGTSMAAPIVSGIAALVRSKYKDKDVYNSRFIMGQIASTGKKKQYMEVNALNALKEVAKPELSYIEHYIFDTKDLNSENNNDGVVDAGETLDIAMVIRNHWGKADNVQVTIDTKGPAGIDDPYVTLITDTVEYGAVGNFGIDDNGLIYEDDVVVGVDHPFQIQIAENTPNDHLILINITLTCSNGFDADTTETYTFNSDFSFLVRRGTLVPNHITEDMTLTNDKYWIVAAPTLIEKAATVTVEQGTQIQFWSVNQSDPYAENKIAYLQVEGELKVNGTHEKPVEMFPSPQRSGYEVKIIATNEMDRYKFSNADFFGGFGNTIGGNCELRYAKIYNPTLSVNLIDHCYITQDFSNEMYTHCPTDWNENKIFDYMGPTIQACNITNTYFYKLGIDNVNDFRFRTLKVTGSLEGNLFDTCSYYFKSTVAKNNVFLKNNRPNRSVGGYSSSKGEGFGYYIYKDNRLNVEKILQYEGHTYGCIEMSNIERLREHDYFYDIGKNDIVISIINDIKEVGWNLATVDSELEKNFINDNYCLDNYTNITTLDNINDDLYSTPIILEIPELIEENEINETIGNNDIFNPIKNNAILNNWIDTNVQYWMKFYSSGNRNNESYLSHNYWGTTSDLLIEKAIVDYNDDFNKGEIIYKPILTEAPETCYPFVTDVYVSTENEERATEVGAEHIQVHVLFNRDMDTDIGPQVSFGPDVPTTDYTVNSVDGGWISPRHWIGETDINPITGDGYQLFRVAGAVAADDPWLVTGNDCERFRFEIITSGTEAMNLQATGGENKINLSWTQDDFDLLAGYNMYRSEMVNGSFTKINETTIPADQNAYEDTEVVPGKTYYYKFKVVKAELIDPNPSEDGSSGPVEPESDFSNVAAASAFDNVPPVINHSAISTATVGLPLQIFADVTDNVGVSRVRLYYRNIDGASYSMKTMTKTVDNRYSVTLEGSLVQAPGLAYYIEASDGITKAKDGLAEVPHIINVTDAPVITSISPSEGSEDGGTDIIITGTNFKEGASVTIGESVASNVVVESDTKITAISPCHYPATVDVKVINTDGYSDTLLNGYKYKSEGVEVSVGSSNGNVGDCFEIPISITEVSGMKALDMTLSYDSDLLEVIDVNKGNLTSSFSLTKNTNTPGKIIISMASSTESSGSGLLTNIEFRVLDSEKISSAITLESIVINSPGSVDTSISNGSFELSDTYNLSGSVSYFTGGRKISNVLLDLQGIKNYNAKSDANGQYSIRNIEQGDYILSASKDDEDTDITAYDASLILQYSAGLITLNANQQIAADVDNNGMITAMDAAYVLEKSVGLLSTPFPGAGKVWTFNPEEKTYTNLNSNRSYENFTAILIGDVSGNWNSEDFGAQGIVDKPSLSLKDTRTKLNSSVSIPLMYDTEELEMGSTNIIINYDTDVVKNINVTKSSLLEDFTMSINSQEPGELEIGLMTANTISGKGKLLDISFDIEETVGKETTITISKAMINEENRVILTSGHIAIAKEGDVNLDNLVDFQDLQEASKSYSNSNYIYDLNNDGIVNIYDLVIIARQLGQ